MLTLFEEQNEISEEYWYDAVRSVMPKPYRNVSEETLDLLLEGMLARVPEEEKLIIVESLGSIAKGIGRFAAKNAGTIGSVVGGGIGSLIAPGVGTALGSTLGGQLGNLAGQAASPGTRTQASPRMPQRPAYSPSLRPSPAQNQSFGGGQRQPVTFASQGMNMRRPETQVLMMASNVQFLVQMVQAIIESLLTIFLEELDRNRTLPVPDPSNASQEEGMIAVEEFANALSVFSEELAIKHAGQNNYISEDVAQLSPKERADRFFRELYPDSLRA